jgi:hypothetical protein
MDIGDKLYGLISGEIYIYELYKIEELCDGFIRHIFVNMLYGFNKYYNVVFTFKHKYSGELIRDPLDDYYCSDFYEILTIYNKVLS